MNEFKDLKIWTSYVTPDLLDRFIKSEILPIFIARNISNSGLIGKWNGSAVHFRELAPSPFLLREWKYNGMSLPEFEDKFITELQDIDIQSIIRRIGLLCNTCNAIGAVLMGYGKDRMQDHRHVISQVFNASGVLENPVKELVL